MELSKPTGRVYLTHPSRKDLCMFYSPGLSYHPHQSDMTRDFLSRHPCLRHTPYTSTPSQISNIERLARATTRIAWDLRTSCYSVSADFTRFNHSTVSGRKARKLLPMGTHDIGDEGGVSTSGRVAYRLSALRSHNRGVYASGLESPRDSFNPRALR